MRAKQENNQMSERAKRQAEYQEFKAKCREEGLKIIAETAETTWSYTQVLDPYDFFDEIPPEADCVGRSYFARNPGSDIWVEFGDLPDETREKLFRAHHLDLGVLMRSGTIEQRRLANQIMKTLAEPIKRDHESSREGD
jgi:hypothetical protein